MGLSEIAYKLFGKYTRGKKYYKLQESMRKARLPSSADVYVTTAMLTAVFGAVGGALVGVVVGVVLALDILLISVLLLLTSAVFGVLTYYLMVAYPGMSAGERARKIDQALPFTLGFMHAMSRSGATVVEIFRELSRREDVGELQGEMKTFMRDIEYLGRDPLTAMRNLARTTPSEKFKNFLDVLVSIVETGGDVTPYMAGKTAELNAYLKDDNNKTVVSMELMGELYIILVEFLPLLFLSILIFMGFLPGQGVDINILRVLGYSWVPIGSIGFIIVLSTVPPIGLKGKPKIFQVPPPFRTIPTTPGDRRDQMVVQKLKGTMATAKLKRILSNPVFYLTESPSLVLFVSVPVAVFYLLFTPIKTLTVVMTILIAAVPYLLFHELKSNRSGELEEALPGFLKSLSSASKSGLTLSRAMRVAASSDMGAMTDEVRRAGKDIEWGASANEALSKLEQRVAVSSTTARSLTLVRKASEAEENIAEVVDITLNDVSTRRAIQADRSSRLFMYKLIILMSFFIFLVTVFFIVDSYIRLPPGTTIGQTAVGTPDPMDIKVLFYHMLLFQGGFAGLIAGELSGEGIRSGFKYAVLMMAFTIVFFELVVLPMTPAIVTPADI